MSSVGSSAATISSSSRTSTPIPLGSHSVHPLKKHREADPKKNWKKIGAIAAAVIGALIAGFAILCAMDYLPNYLLGGTAGIGASLIVGAAIAIPSAYFAYQNW